MCAREHLPSPTYRCVKLDTCVAIYLTGRRLELTPPSHSTWIALSVIQHPSTCIPRNHRNLGRRDSQVWCGHTHTHTHSLPARKVRPVHPRERLWQGLTQPPPVMREGALLQVGLLAVRRQTCKFL